MCPLNTLLRGWTCPITLTTPAEFPLVCLVWFVWLAPFRSDPRLGDFAGAGGGCGPRRQQLRGQMAGHRAAPRGVGVQDAMQRDPDAKHHRLKYAAVSFLVQYAHRQRNHRTRIAQSGLLIRSVVP